MQAASSPQIQVRALSHVYAARGQPVPALADVDLEVPPGEFVSIIGPSGGGKTTLLKAMGGLLEPTAGIVEVGGKPASEARRSKAIGFIFQDPALLPWRTVYGNVALSLELNRQPSDETRADPDQLLDTVGLSEFRDRYPHELSGGMRQRVSFARALVLDPAVLLMDEPLGALDEITRTAMRYELVRIWEQAPKTVVLVTHSIPEAVIMSDRVAVLSPRPGRIVRRFRIDLPRPREESYERSPEFLQYARQIRETLSLGAPDGATASEAAV